MCKRFFQSHVKFSFENKLLSVTIYDRSIVCQHQARQAKYFSECEIFSGLEKDAGARQCRRRRRGPPATSPVPEHIGGQDGGRARDYGRRDEDGARSAGTRAD